MAGWRFCALFNKKEAVTVILWYAACVSVNFSVFSFLDSWIQNNTIIFIVTSSSIIILYSFLGLFGDVFVGRYRLIQFSLWVKLLTAIICTLIISILTEYHLHTWLQTLLYSIVCVIEELGESSFHVVAVQFGTDQLQGAPSEFLSAFIFWYFIAEIIPSVLFLWIYYFSSFKPANIQLGGSLLCAVFISVVLAIKNCFMSKWFVRETAMSSVCKTTSYRDCRTDNSNPYRLIFCVQKFAKQHKSPIQRSALTYWEDAIPSRIDLGKKKYGGPFTTEEVESVKTFLQLFKLLLSLLGIFVTSYLVNPLLSATDSESESDNTSQVVLIDALCLTATGGLLILCRAFSYFFKCHLSMLKRIGIGAVLTTVCVLCILLINLVKFYYATTIDKDHTLLYMNVVPQFLAYISYFLLTVSLFEFIVAQSPHTMKGMLIGFFYVIRFGVAGLIALVGHYALKKLPCTNAINCSDIVSNIVIIIIALLSFIMYCIVACKYKLRERDEVVNVHIFAEEYYGIQEDDYTDMNHDVHDSNDLCD